jgi:CarboxypepD_reg-like domain
MVRASKIVVAAFTVLASSAQSQTIHLAGRVTSESAQPLAAAQVYLLEIGIGGVTDADGKYAFDFPAERAHGKSVKLAARLIGFKPVSVEVALGDTAIENNFVLAVNSYQPVCCIDLVTPQPTYALTTASILDVNAKISRAAGLGELRLSHHHGEREIRIWMWGTSTYEIYRLVERSGQFSGTRVRYRSWSNEQLRASQLRFDTQPLGKGCARASMHGLIFTCIVRIPSDADWQQPWSELEAAGVWDLPAFETLEQPIVVEDGGGSVVTIELWDGEAHRAWSYLMSYGIGSGRIPDGQEQAYEIWRVTRGINLLSSP